MRNLHHRRSIRLQDYDYSQDGAYFITICAYRRQCIFSRVVDSAVELTELGKIVEEEWLHTAELRPGVVLDDYIIMPNHVHMIVVLDNVETTTREKSDFVPQARSISTLIRGFKGMITTRINTARNTPGIPIWQRNYFEQVIRNEAAMNAIREYIQLNPARWTEDKENPRNIKQG